MNMPAYRVLSSFAIAAVSLMIVCAAPGFGHAQSSSRGAEQGQVKKASPNANKGSQVASKSRKAKRRLAKRPGAPANNQFDGSWTVSLHGGAGECRGHSLTYGVQIRNGNIGYAGGDASVTGRVTASGGVSVRVVSGDRMGTASGRLSRSSGGGTFQGQVGGSPCSGNWSAGRA